MNVLKRAGPVLSAAVVAAAIAGAGCTSSKTTSVRTSVPTPTHTSTTPSAQPSDVGAAYVRTIDELCAMTEADVVKVVPSGYSAATPVRTFLKQAPRLRAIYRAFDLEFAKVAVPPGGSAAAAAMRAYVTTSDATKKKAIAAANRGQAAYRAEYNRQLDFWGTGAGAAVLAKRDAAGISQDCNYR